VLLYLYDVQDYDRTYTDLVKRYEISTSQMTTDWFILSYSQSGPFVACNMSSTMGSTSGAGTAYLSGPHEFTSRFKWCSCCTIVSFLCGSVLSRLFWSLHWLTFSYVWLLITPLASSNISYKVIQLHVLLCFYDIPTCIGN
jgi:hypothetical protein